MPDAPIALHTFKFIKWYKSIYTALNTWSLDPTFLDLTGISGEGISCTASDLRVNSTRYGAVAYDDFHNQTLFLGNGLPTAPIAITSTNVSGPSSPYNGPLVTIDYWDTQHGAFYYNNAYWLLVGDQGAAGATFPYHMLKSTDDGVSWSVQDETHEPIGIPSTATPGKGVGSERAVFRDLFTSKFWWFGNEGSSFQFYNLYSFDLSTATWSLVSSLSEPIDDFNFGRGVSLVAFNDGSVGVFYNKNFVNVGQNNIYYRRFVGGISSAESIAVPTDVSSGFMPAQLVLDPDGVTIHFVYYANNGDLGKPIYQRFDINGNAIAGTKYTFPVANLSNDGVGHGAIMPDPYDNNKCKIWLPFDQTTTYPGDAFPANAIWSSPITGTPSFTRMPLPVPVAEQGNAPSCAYVASSIICIPPAPAGGNWRVREA